MRTRIHFWIRRILDLPSQYFYAAWLCLFLLIIFYLVARKDNHTRAALGPTNAQLIQIVEPEKVVSPRITYKKLSSEAPSAFADLEDLNTKLSLLEQYISKRLRGDEAKLPLWISEDVVAKGIDRSSFQPRFKSESIDVSRWRTSDAAPEFVGDQAFGKFIDSCFGPWRKSRDFQISIRSYKTEVGPESTAVSLIMECDGLVDSSRGGQASAIWIAKWSPGVSQRQLKEIFVLAQEEVNCNVNQGKIFQDCTAAILKRCSCLDDRLVYGLDEWAQRIPNLDVRGEQGLAVGDINRDGLVDLYVCQPHGLPNILLIQNPDGTVDDVSRESQVDLLDQTHGALMIDLDNDRDQDLVLTTDEGLVLMSNKGNEVFQIEHTLPIGRGARSVSAVDYDRDGDLDLYLCKYDSVEQPTRLLDLSSEELTSIRGGRNVLLKNNEGWSFQDVTESVGFTIENHQPTRAASWCDYDSDGDQDLFLCNDYGQNRLYRNDEGWFTDLSSELEMNLPGRYRSVSVGDFNRDGYFDFFTAAMIPGSLRLSVNSSRYSENNTVPNRLAEIARAEDHVWYGNPDRTVTPFYLRAPLFSAGSASSSAVLDVNKDGRDDIVVGNGMLSRSPSSDIAAVHYLQQSLGFDSDIDEIGSDKNRWLNEIYDLCLQGYSFAGHERNKCYLSIGKLGFANLSAVSGLNLPEDTRSIAVADWDNDGDADLILSCRSGPQIRFFCNQLITENGFVSFELQGRDSNADAIGARVELHLAGIDLPLIKTLQAGSGYLSQSSKQIEFGVEKGSVPEKVVVVWPNGNVDSFENLSVNSRYTIVEGASELAEKTVGRFNFSIDSQKLDAKTAPPKIGRSPFIPASGLPGLQFMAGDQNYFPVETIDNKSMFVLIFGNDSRSESLLNEIRSAAQSFVKNDLDCLALYCDEKEPAILDRLSTVKRAIKKCRFPLRWGVLTDASLRKLELACGKWFSSQQIPQLPFGLLFNGENGLVGYYTPSDISPAAILKDQEYLRSGQADLLPNRVSLQGRWASNYRYEDYSSLTWSLSTNGFDNQSDRMNKLSSQYLAHQLCHQSIELNSRKEHRRAKMLLDKAVELDEENVLARLELGNTCRNLALNDTNLVEEERFLLQEMAADHYKLAGELDVSNPQAVIGQANIAIAQGNIPKAIEILTDYIDVVPDQYETLAMVGRLMFLDNRDKEAAEYLGKAFDNRPSLPFVAGDLGFLYLYSGQFKEARGFLQLAHRLQPSDRNIKRHLAEAEYACGNFVVATDMLRKVVEDEPNRRRTQLLYAWCLAACPYESRRDGKESLNVIAPFVEFDGDRWPSVLEIQAAAFAELGDFEKALEVQSAAVALAEGRTGAEVYTNQQILGLMARQELYRRGKPFRISDVMRAPVTPPSSPKD